MITVLFIWFHVVTEVLFPSLRTDKMFSQIRNLVERKKEKRIPFKVKEAFSLLKEEEKKKKWCPSATVYCLDEDEYDIDVHNFLALDNEEN